MERVLVLSSLWVCSAGLTCILFSVLERRDYSSKRARFYAQYYSFTLCNWAYSSVIRVFLYYSSWTCSLFQSSSSSCRLVRAVRRSFRSVDYFYVFSMISLRIEMVFVCSCISLPYFSLRVAVFFNFSSNYAFSKRANLFFSFILAIIQLSYMIFILQSSSYNLTLSVSLLSQFSLARCYDCSLLFSQLSSSTPYSNLNFYCSNCSLLFNNCIFLPLSSFISPYRVLTLSYSVLTFSDYFKSTVLPASPSKSSSLYRSILDSISDSSSNLFPQNFLPSNLCMGLIAGLVLFQLTF